MSRSRPGPSLFIRWKSLLVAVLAAGLVPASATGQFGRAPNPEAQMRAEAARGTHVQSPMAPAQALRQVNLMATALGGLQPQRPGTVDAYVISIGLDSDGVFGREAAETGRVLSRRFDAEGRTIVLANGTGAGDGVPMADPNDVAAALARIGQLMDPAEDVLVLYVTTHGHWVTGLAWKDGNRGAGHLGPVYLAGLLDEIGARNRLLIISACFSGVFVPILENDNSYVITAASSDRSSFGCDARNDWTFFGDALINHAFRKPIGTEAAFTEARDEIEGWERSLRVPQSQPQQSKGRHVDRWLSVLDRRVPAQAGTPVGRPAYQPPG